MGQAKDFVEFSFLEQRFLPRFELIQQHYMILDHYDFICLFVNSRWLV